MKNYKKITAAVMSLLISMSAALPAVTAYAENEESAISEDAGEAVALTIENEEETGDDAAVLTIENEDEENSEIVSGEYTYIVNEDGSATIIDCSSDEKEITIPDTIDDLTVTGIGAEAFIEKIINKITIPATVSNIAEENPFASLLHLQEIVVDEENESYTAVDGVLYTKDMKTILCYPASKSGSAFTIPDGVETVGIAAVSSTGLTEIVLPDSVSSVKRHCFSFNEKLEKLHMDNTAIDQIPVMSFANCSNLTDLTFSESTTYIDLAAFISCKKLSKITLPSNLRYIAQSAFQGTSIMEIVIPETVTTIGYCAFGYDENENIMDGLLIVGAEGSAAEVYATDKDEDYGLYNDFTFISHEMYNKQKEYEALDKRFSGDFEYTVVDGEGMITNCITVGDIVEIPAEIDGITITSLYYAALLNCDSATIILPETIKSIGESVFSEYLVNLTIPGGCTEIAGEEPFLKCSRLQSITVTEGDGAYSSEDGVLYNKDKTVLIAYPSQKTEEDFKLPKTVKEIAKSGFCYNQNIKKADLSDVENIGEYAFEGCTALEEVKLPKNLKTVQKNAFLGCPALLSVRVPADVEYIGDYAFGYDYDSELAADIQQNMDMYAQAGQSAVMPYSVINGFKMYVEEDSLAYQYAQSCGIETVIDTVSVGGNNMSKGFVYAVLGGIAAIVLLIAGIITGRKLSTRKKNKESEKRKAIAAEKIKAKKEAAANNEAQTKEDADNENK